MCDYVLRDVVWCMFVGMIIIQHVVHYFALSTLGSGRRQKQQRISADGPRAVDQLHR